MEARGRVGHVARAFRNGKKWKSEKRFGEKNVKSDPKTFPCNFRIKLTINFK